LERAKVITAASSAWPLSPCSRFSRWPTARCHFANARWFWAKIVPARTARIQPSNSALRRALSRSGGQPDLPAGVDHVHRGIRLELLDQVTGEDVRRIGHQELDERLDVALEACEDLLPVVAGLGDRVDDGGRSRVELLLPLPIEPDRADGQLVELT
jgi:hypothetical protein